MNNILVFYAGLLYSEISNDDSWRLIHKSLRDIPNGAYVRYPNNSWLYSDFTPVLPDDVPKELLLLTLLLT